MATLYRVDGKTEEVEPRDKKKGFSLEELYKLIDTDMVEVVRSGKAILIIDEEGKIKRKPRNNIATDLATHLGPGDFIVGDVLRCKKGEFK